MTKDAPASFEMTYLGPLSEGRNLKNAGVLLFCHGVEKSIPQATITCVLYRGDTKYKILAMKEYGLERPNIETDDNWFSIIFRRRKKGMRPGSEETSEETSEKIINLMRSNPKITAKQMSHEIGITPRAVEMWLSKLKGAGKIKRTGSTKSGHWEVMD